MKAPRSDEILARMDEAAVALRTASRLLWDGKRVAFSNVFPTLANTRLDLASCRLAGYRLNDWWAITVETFGFCAYEPQGHRFPVWVATLSPSAAVPLDPYYPVVDRGLVGGNEEVDEVGECYVRGVRVDVPLVLGGRPKQDPAPTSGILGILPFFRGRARQAVSRPPDAAEFARLLAAHSGDQLLATEAERRDRRIPAAAELLIELHEWYHPNVEVELPSEVESMVQLAEVLATGDPSHYRPTRPPNSHWSHWV